MVWRGWGSSHRDLGALDRSISRKFKFGDLELLNVDGGLFLVIGLGGCILDCKILIVATYMRRRDILRM